MFGEQCCPDEKPVAFHCLSNKTIQSRIRECGPALPAQDKLTLFGVDKNGLAFAFAAFRVAFKNSPIE